MQAWYLHAYINVSACHYKRVGVTRIISSAIQLTYSIMDEIDSRSLYCLLHCIVFKLYSVQLWNTWFTWPTKSAFKDMFVQNSYDWMLPKCRWFVERTHALIMCDRIWKKTRLPHTQYQTYNFTRNGLLAQYTITFHCWPCSKATGLVFVAAFLRPCVSLKWHFGAIGWSWLSCIGAWRAGQATKDWPMSVIFNLECCEHKKGTQTGPLAFNYLRIPFCTPILSPASTPTHHPYYYHLHYHYCHKKSCSKQLEFRVFEVIHPHNYS